MHLSIVAIGLRFSTDVCDWFTSCLRKYLSVDIRRKIFDMSKIIVKLLRMPVIVHGRLRVLTGEMRLIKCYLRTPADACDTLRFGFP